jgi:ABC-type Fe3+-siderophore transport system permease subunit
MFLTAAAPLLAPTFEWNLAVHIAQWAFFACGMILCWILGRKHGANTGPRTPFASKLLIWALAALGAAIIAVVIIMNIAADEHRASVKTWLNAEYGISATTDQVRQLTDGAEATVDRNGEQVLIKFRATAGDRIGVSEMKGETVLTPTTSAKK